MANLFRGWNSRTPAPSIDPDRTICSNCIYHSQAVAGPNWDRCTNPKADDGSLVRNGPPKCNEMRLSESQCGRQGSWFKNITDLKEGDA